MKTMKILILTILLLIPTSAYAEWYEVAPEDRWTFEDTTREVVFGVLHVIDMGQTLDSIDQPDRYREMNFFMGENPERETVWAFFILTGVAHVGISWLLPRDYRDMWQYVTIGGKGAIVGHNHSIGLRVRF